MPHVPPRFRVTRPRRTTRWSAIGLLVLLVTAVVGCGHDEPRPWPKMPETPLENGEWFWRNVLAAPMEGEPAPRRDVLEASPPAAVVDGLAALFEQSDPAALNTAMAALRHKDDGVAIAAAELIGRSGQLAAIPRLVKGFGPYPVDYDVPIAVRVAQASALARLGNPSGMPLLLAILAEDTPAQLPRAKLEWDETQQLVFLRELALPGVVALTGSDFDYEPNGSVPAREESARRAQAFWDEHAVDLWRTAPAPSSDPGFETRARLLVANLRAFQLRNIDGARYALSHFGPGVMPQLEEGLASSDDYSRAHTLEILAMMCDKVDAKTRGRIAVTAARPLLDDPSPSVAAEAARTCGAARVADPLVEALGKRTEGEVRLAIVDALGATRLPTAALVLRDWSAQNPSEGLPPDLRVALCSALFLCDPAEPPTCLLDDLASPDPDVAYPAVERLIALTGGDQGIDAAVPPEQRAEGLKRAAEILADPALRTAGR